MSIRGDEAVRAKALSVSAVTALIGSGSAARWYPNAAPQGVAYPCVVCDVISMVPRDHLSGTGWGITRLDLRIYGVDKRVDASTQQSGYEVCQAVAEQLRLALHITKENVTVGVETVLATIWLREQLDAPAGVIDGTDKPVFGVLQRYEISMAQA